MRRVSHFRPLINEMLVDLIFCWQSKTAELVRVETAIMITRKYCDRLKNEIFIHPFTCDEEELFFFKKIQPHFTGKLCYYTILYEALVSSPLNEINEFWENELKRYHRFKEKHAAFIDYMDNCCTDKDELYFLRRSNLNAQSLHSKLYGLGADLYTSHDHLASALFAERLYYNYVVSKTMISVR